MEPDATFRTSVRQRHAEAFDIASRVATTLGEACVLRAVTTDDETAIALDMLVQQAWQAHASVCILTERTYVHSAMILTRHLLELSVQALYIVGAAPPETPRDRARRFLAKLWTGIPEDARSSFLSQESVDAWARRADEWTRELPPNPKAWWPNFREMFEANGMGAAYAEDYRYLSGDAHGSAWLAPGNYMRVAPGILYAGFGRRRPVQDSRCGRGEGRIPRRRRVLRLPGIPPRTAGARSL